MGKLIGGDNLIDYLPSNDKKKDSNNGTNQEYIFNIYIDKEATFVHIDFVDLIPVIT